MEKLVVDLHVLIVDGPVESDGDHHGQLAQLQLASLHTQAKTTANATTTFIDVINSEMGTVPGATVPSAEQQQSGRRQAA